MSPYFIKICGIMNEEDAVTAAEAGATAIGLNFYRNSKRYVDPAGAKRIAESVRGRAAVVGVFVNEQYETVRSIAASVKLTYCQFHGDEPPEMINRFPNAIKAFRVDTSLRNVQFDEFRAVAFLLDAFDEREFGGTGKKFNWLLAREANDFGRIILAGGLTPDNVRDAIDIASPWGVDVSSGVEHSPGKKDPEKMKKFIAAAREAFESHLEHS